MKEKAINTLHIIIVSFIFSTAIGYSFAAWTPPAGSPPFGNTPPPINVGDATQERKGNLILDHWLFAQKAQTQSTVATDDPKTLTTKDYVDTKVSQKIKFVSGNSCAQCPYGSYEENRTSYSVRVSCSFKNENGTLLTPLMPWIIPQNESRVCYSSTNGVSTVFPFNFWTY